MKLIRLAILSFVFLFLIVYGISLFIPSHIRISRAVNIKATSEAVLAKVKDINKWKEWYPGFDTMRVEPVTLQDGRLVTARLSKTEITVTSVQGNEITAQFKSGEKNPVVSGWRAQSYNNSDSLTVQWYLDFKLKWYPWEKFFSLAYDKMYGSQMEQGLNNLKKNVE